MREEQKQTRAGNVVLAKKTGPALSPGRWRLHVEQKLSGHEKLKECLIRPEEFVFSCEASPFSLEPSQVYSVYPPRDSFGRFETILPHIVLKRRTLPWERKIGECPGAPWLALLLFSEAEDAVVKTVKRKKQGIKNRNQEEAEESCTELSISADLFQQVCPSREDMELSVHSRFTSRDDKVTEKDRVEDWMAVVTANRLPCSSQSEKGLKNTVYLVSMESMGKYLLNRGAIGKEEERVCVPVLASWSFYSRKEEYDFRTLFQGLSADALRIPSPDGAGERVKGLLERGYVPLNHCLRDGGKTVSWYHGPFRPWNPGAREMPGQLFSDAGLIYEPELGMFDVSTAAAFNLGRMLAIRDPAFAGALVRFREGNKREAARVHNERLLRHALEKTGVLESQGRLEAWPDAGEWKGKNGRKAETGRQLDMLAAQLLMGIGGAEKNKEKGASGKRAGGLEGEPGKRLGSLFTAPLRQEGMFNFLQTGNTDGTVPEELIRPLSGWSLLYGVPCRYLVPDGHSLPPESIRFFYMDHGWLSALLDGALSLGRLYDVDYQHDSWLIQEALERAYEHRLEVRLRLQGKTGQEFDRSMKRRRENLQSCRLAAARDRRHGPEPGRNPVQDPGAFLSTGFLLRSELVSGWRGLEFRAYADTEKTQLLTALRIETLGPDILLGIFVGRIACLEIGQPPEGMHFGVERKKEGGYRKLLRNPEDGALYDKEGIYAEVAVRSQEYGVLDWKATADKIRAALPGGGSVDSGCMALEMIQNPASGAVVLEEGD